MTRTNTRLILLSAGSVFLLTASVIVAPPARAQDIYVYPAKGQTQAQQDKDRYECHTWAVSQTGYDPSKASASAGTAPASGQTQPNGRPVLRGAARGAALGGVGGAIAGDAGKGAAAGTAMGGMAGGFRRRDEMKQQQASAQQSDTANANANSAARDAYNRALGACLKGRGYTVN